jgi:hypothetical protein
VPTLGTVTIATGPNGTNHKAVAGRWFGAHPWTTQLGVAAPEVVWLLEPSLAEAVLQLNETEIRFQPANGPPQTYKRIKVVRETPTGDPTRRAVVLSDVRWYFPRITVKRTYNETVQSGDLRLQAIAGIPVQNQPITPVQVYASYSLKGADSGGSQNARPWAPSEIVADVLAYLMQRTGAPTNARSFTDVSRLGKLSDFPPADVKLWGPGDAMLSEVLALMGGVDVRVEPDGSVTILDAQLGLEKDMLERNVPYAISGKGALTWIDMGKVAPFAVDVYYWREVEIRADGWEQAPTFDPSLNTTSLQVIEDPGDLPILENVIQVSDLQLTCFDIYSGALFTAIQGMYVPVDSWTYGVFLKQDYASPPGPFTRLWMIQHYFGAQWENAYVTGTFSGVDQPSAVWAGRSGSARTHFRRTYRLNPRFAHRCVPGSIRPVRAGLLDPINGVRSPSPVFMPYCRRPTTRGLQKDVHLGWNFNAGMTANATQNVGTAPAYLDPAWPDQLVPLASLTAAPATLGVLDSTNGVFRIDLKKDPFDQAAELVPSQVSQLPLVDANEVSVTGGLATWERAQLTQTHRVVFLFSAIPAGPNNEGSLHRYTVPAVVALARLFRGIPGEGQDAVSAKGPLFDLRVDRSLVTARIAWDDELNNVLLACFTDPVGQTTQGGTDGNVLLSSAIAQTLTPVNDDQLRDYAISRAAILFAALLDHYEGTATVDVNFRLVPQGSVGRVDHVVDEEGVMTTTVFAAPVRPTISADFRLSQGTRTAILGALGGNAGTS